MTHVDSAVRSTFLRRSQDCALRESFLRCRRNSPEERKLRASGATVSAMLARSGATTATAAPPLNCWHPFTRRSPRVSTRPTLGTLKFCSTRWPDHARSWGTFRGQSGPVIYPSVKLPSCRSHSTGNGWSRLSTRGWPPSPTRRSLALVKVCLPKSQNSVSSSGFGLENDNRDASAPGRLVTGRLDWRRASATRFAYGRCPRQSSQHLGEPIEGTFAIRL